MAFVNLSGVLTDSIGLFDVGSVLTITHVSTTGNVLPSTVTKLIVPPNGAYNINLNYGNVRFDYTSEFTKSFIAIVTVNADTTATSIPELLNANVPPTNAQLLEFQDLLSDAQTAETNAAASAVSAAASAASLTATLTLSAASVSVTAAEFDYVDIIDREMARFQYLTGQTDNSYNIVAAAGSLSLVLVVTGAVNAKHLGAGLGSGDDTLALQASIDLALSLTSSQLYLPSGTYIVSDDLVIPAGSSISIKGDGREATYFDTGLVGFDITKSVFRYDGTSSSPCEYCTLEGLTIRARFFGKGVKAAFCFPKFVMRDVEIKIPDQYGVYLDECWTASLYDVSVDGENSTSLYGIYLINANNISLYNPRIYNMKNTVQSTGIGATSAEVFGIYGGNIENCPRGVYVTTGGAFGGPVVIRDIYFEPRGMSAFDAGQPNDHIKIEGTVNRSGSVTVEGCLFQSGSASVPIAFNAVSAENLGALIMQGNTWQKAKYTTGGEGENVFIDVDSTVAKVLENGNTLISTNLGNLRSIPDDVINTINNVDDSGSAAMSNNLPKFSARIESTKINVTGAGATYTVVFETEDYDIGTNYDNATGIFTASYDGFYRFDLAVQAENVLASHTTAMFELVTTDQTYVLAADSTAATRDGSDDRTYSGSVSCELSAGDTVKVNLTISGGTGTVDLKGFAGSGLGYFNGYFVQ